jgi:hypothetical protein
MTASVPRASRTPAQLRDVLTAREVAEPSSRRAAAIELARTGDPGVQNVLISALGFERDPRVRAGIVKALGWIGDADAYPPLIAAGAAFAARLVAHRHGLKGSELPALELPEVLPPPPATTAKSLDITIPSAKAVRRCLSSIDTRSFGLAIDENSLRVMRCARTEWILLLSRDLAYSANALLARRAIPFALALFMPETSSYSISHVALSTPPDALVVCRSTGAPLFAGEFRISRDGLRVSLAALRRPGAFPVDITAQQQHGVLSMDRAVYGPIAVSKRIPVPFDPLSPRVYR